LPTNGVGVSGKEAVTFGYPRVRVF
jgi:hypothetical protein